MGAHEMKPGGRQIARMARRITSSDNATKRIRMARSIVAVAWLLVAFAAAVASAARAQMPQTKFDVFTATLGDYEQAVRLRASAKSIDTESRMRESAQRLRAAGGAYAESVSDITGETADRRNILQDLQEYEDAGTRLATFADDQRALAVDYLNRCAMMGARARDSVDEAWRVFGHVFARRSLIALNAQIEELRSRAQNLSDVHGSDLDAVADALAATEAAIAATLSGDERGLARTQGEEWTAQMRGDLEWFSASRTKLQAMDVHQSVLLSQFAELGKQLGKRPTFREFTTSEAPTLVKPIQNLRSTESSSEASPMETPPADAGAASFAVAPEREHARADGNVNVWWMVGGAALLTFVLIGIVARRRRNAARRLVASSEADAFDTELPASLLALDQIADRLTDGAETKVELVAASGYHGEHEQVIHTSANDFEMAQANLRRAFEQHEFELVFQPELSLHTFAVESVDALVTLSQPDGGLTTPEQLTMEGSELILDIGDWALRAAVDAAARWHHGNWRQARINVSVVTQQLREPRFVERVKALLDEHRVPPSCIEFGVREALLRDGAQTLGTLRQLRAHGIGIALTDFGAGYLPFSSLKHYPLTRVRLDRSLATDLDAARRMRAIARSLVGWAKTLDLCIDRDSIEQLARRLCEMHLCELRHYVRCDLPGDPAELGGAPESFATSYESCIGFRESFIVKSTAQREVNRDS